MRITRMILTLGAAVSVAAPNAGLAQAVRAASLVPTTAKPGQLGGAATMIRNRARVFGRGVSHAGVAYFATNDADLRGKTSDEILQRLTPNPIGRDDDVRRAEIVIDLRRPVEISTTATRTVEIGTTHVSSARRRRLEVETMIRANTITVRRSKP